MESIHRSDSTRAVNESSGAIYPSTPSSQHESQTPVWVLTLCVLGTLAFCWLAALRYFPDLAPGIHSSANEAGQVRVLDVSGYLSRHPDTTQEQITGAVQSIVDALTAHGVVVVGPDAVLGAPQDAVITDAVIQSYVSAAGAASGGTR